MNVSQLIALTSQRFVSWFCCKCGPEAQVPDCVVQWCPERRGGNPQVKGTVLGWSAAGGGRKLLAQPLLSWECALGQPGLGLGELS